MGSLVVSSCTPSPLSSRPTDLSELDSARGAVPRLDCYLESPSTSFEGIREWHPRVASARVASWPRRWARCIPAAEPSAAPPVANKEGMPALPLRRSSQARVHHLEHLFLLLRCDCRRLRKSGAADASSRPRRDARLLASALLWLLRAPASRCFQPYPYRDPLVYRRQSFLIHPPVMQAGSADPPRLSIFSPYSCVPLSPHITPFRPPYSPLSFFRLPGRVLRLLQICQRPCLLKSEIPYDPFCPAPPAHHARFPICTAARDRKRTSSGLLLWL